MKIAICVPVHGDTRAEFTIALANMVAASGGAPDLELRAVARESSDIADNRSQLVLEAHQWGAKAILWLDSDHTFPADTLLRLLQHKKPIVGCNYPRRADAAPTAKALDGNGPVFTTRAKAERGELEQVAALGLGVCLMQMQVLSGVAWPIFDRTMNGSKLDIGEDVFFFRKMTGAGVPVFCDHGLSWQVGHVASRIITNADTERLMPQD